MPNGHTHILTGMIAGGVTSLVLQNKNTKFDFAHTAFALTIGGASGRLPDIIEPAIHPNHRSIFHSFLFGFILMCLGKNLFDFLMQNDTQETDEKKNNWMKVIAFIILIGIAAYLIHLILDGFSKKGLPFIQ